MDQAKKFVPNYPLFQKKANKTLKSINLLLFRKDSIFNQSWRTSKIYLEKIYLFEGNRCLASLKLKIQIFNTYMQLIFFWATIYKMHNEEKRKPKKSQFRRN